MWLARAAEASFVVTSRERLHVQGEQVLALEPLPLATTTRSRSFVARARAQRADFDSPTPTATTWRRIVGLLDGLPLAIELAAARVRRFCRRRSSRCGCATSNGARRRAPAQRPAGERRCARRSTGRGTCFCRGGRRRWRCRSLRGRLRASGCQAIDRPRGAGPRLSARRRPGRWWTDLLPDRRCRTPSGATDWTSRTSACTSASAVRRRNCGRRASQRRRDAPRRVPMPPFGTDAIDALYTGDGCTAAAYWRSDLNLVAACRRAVARGDGNDGAGLTCRALREALDPRGRSASRGRAGGPGGQDGRARCGAAARSRCPCSPA